MSYPFTDEDQRKTERLPTLMDVSVRIGEHEVDGTLIEIGGGGAKVRLTQIKHEASESNFVILCIPKFGTFDGNVAWSEGQLIGIEFEESHKVLVGLIREANAQGRAA